MGNCIATLYLPIDEDFGISPVESMSAGKPVIGVNEGGIKETVIPGKTGLLCPVSLGVKDVVCATNSMTKELALSMRIDCEARAKQFSSQVFRKKINKLSRATLESIARIAREVDAS